MESEWFSPTWLAQAPGLPRFTVRDTRSAQGVLDTRTKPITVADLVKFHGHACDGLVRAAYAFRALFDAMLGPDEPIDRTDLQVVSKNSPCLGDVAAYLTGGRVRFGTHRLDPDLGVGFVVQRLSDGLTFAVREEVGFFPPLISAWETELLGNDLDEESRRELIAVNEARQWDWVRFQLLPSRPSDHYHAQRVSGEVIPTPIMTARRTDVVNRNVSSPREYRSPDAGGPADPTAAISRVAEPTKWERLYDQGPAVLHRHHAPGVTN